MFSKCEFRLASATILGHIISSEGIQVNIQETKTVKNWPKLKSLINVRSFLGLDGYYRRLMEGWTLLAKLTQTKSKFQQLDACEKSFQELKSNWPLH